MPKLSNKILEGRIRALRENKNTWIKVNYPGSENGGIMEIRRAQKNRCTVYIWDTHKQGRAWRPHNKRCWIYSGVVEGAIGLVRTFRKGHVELPPAIAGSFLLL